MKHKNHPQSVIAGLTRNLLSKKGIHSRLGDGGSLSAMMVKALALVIVIMMTSCEKEIEFNGEQSDPKLVINSLVEPGQPVSAAISKSFFFLDNTANTIAPDDLVATLYVNGNLIGEMTPHFDTLVSYDIWNPNESSLGHVRKVYTHEYCPVDGDIVKITATANDYDEVEGTTSDLPKIADCQMDVEVEEWHSEYYHPYFDEYGVYEEDSLLKVWGYLNLTFTITDPNPGKTDCFRLATSKSYNINDGENMRYISFEYDDPVFGASMTENDFFDASDLDTRPEGVFTDMLFDGSSYRLKVRLYFECDLDEVFDPDFFRVPFMVEHLSKEYYNYLNTCNQGDMSLQIWTEPIQTYSNVTNGYGIVAGRAVNTKWLNLPIEEP